MLFIGSFKIITQYTTYASITGAITLDANLVYLRNISLTMDLFITNFVNTLSDTRWTTSSTTNGTDAYLGLGLICQPNTCAIHTDLFSIQTIMVATGVSGSDNTLSRVTYKEIGNKSNNFIIRLKSKITLAKLRVMHS